MIKFPAIGNSHLFARALSSALLASALLLGGCGGGGGGSSSSSPPASSVPASPAATAPTSITTAKNTMYTGKLIASDLNGDPLTYSIVSSSTRGTALVTNPDTGDFTYTPNPGEEGSDSFSFKANDGSKDSNVVTVSVTITNTAPVAQDGNADVNEDTTSGTLNLAASDDDGDPLSFSIVSNGTRGTAVITDAASGTYTYTPAPGQIGIDTFTFNATDGSSVSNVATVTVTINGKPLATGSCGTVKQSNQTPGLVGKLDASDPEGSMQLMYSLLNPDGSDAGLTLVTAKGGTVTITDPTTGIFTYKADTGPGDNRGQDTFDFQVIDPEGAIATATETVIVDQTIMPLGDSITEGSDFTGGSFAPKEERVGYRRSLYDQLITSQYMIDFVGSVQSGSAAIPTLDDIDHEGHGGWTAFDIANGRNMDGTDGVKAWLDQHPADVILLHIGTNDLSNTTADEIAAILNIIHDWEISANGNPVTVLLARILDQVPLNPEVGTFNDAVEAMVNLRTEDEPSIIIVDQETGAGINYTIDVDMSDQLHPNVSGYGKMANTWFSSLAPLLDKCP